MSAVDFVLASASPRRKELLRQIGARFSLAPVDVDETPWAGETPEDYVVRLALAKARAAFGDAGGLPVLGADTTVTIDGRILGKPENEEESVAMLRSLSGRSHRVLTAIALVSADRSAWRISDTRVTFAPVTVAQCRRYWQTGEPADKAGGYGIQGFGAVFIDKIEGSYSGVAGLPLAQTRELLELFAIPYWQPLPGRA